MSTLSVSNGTQLRSALSAAKPGDTILLASGNYGSFAFNDLKYSGYVTVRSADPGRQATFTDIDVHNSSYLRIDRVHVSNPSNGSSSSKVVDIDKGSHHVEFLNSQVNGTGGGGSGYANYQGHYGIYTGSASNIRVQGNHVHDVKNGIVSIGTTNLQHVGNRIDYIGNDSFKFAGVRNVLIEDNTGASHVYPEPGAHLDFIQFQGSDSSDIVIRGNVYLGGTTAWVQGIFLDDAFYRNVLIENNVIYTGQANGILVTAGSGVVARYNTVLNNPGDGHKATTIRLPAGSVSQNNITGGEQGSLGGSDIRIQYIDPRAANYYNKVYADAMDGLGITIADLRPVAGGLATSKGAYARIMEILNGGGAPAPTPTPTPDPDPAPSPDPDPAPSPGSPIDSDDFSAATLSGFWAFEGPAGTSARLGAGGGNEYLELRVPDGNFDIYRTTKKAARLMQDAPDSDFQVETRFLTNPTTKNQSQGILVEQDGDSWIRFDTYFNGSDLKAFAAVTLDGATTNRINLTIPGDFAPYLKVIHRGDAWTFAWSADGEVWKTAGSFTQKLDVNAIGPFASGVDSPYTARVDYFENLAAPIANEDGAGSRSGAAAPAAPAAAETVFARAGEMRFDGAAGDAVSLAHREALEIDQGAIAFSFAADRIDLKQGLVSKDARGHGNDFAAWIEDGALKVRVQDEAGGAWFRVGVTAGAEHDVLATFDERAVLLWVDGKLVGGKAFDLDLAENVEALTIGGLGGGARPLDGSISDLMIFDHVGTPTDLGLI